MFVGEITFSSCLMLNSIVSSMLNLVTHYSKHETATIYIYIYAGFLKWWYPQIISFNGMFHYKPSILGYPHSRTPSYIYIMCVYRYIMYNIYMYIIYTPILFILWLVMVGDPHVISTIYIYIYSYSMPLYLVGQKLICPIGSIHPRTPIYIPFHSYNSLRSCRSYGSSHGQFTCNRWASSLHISYVHIISLFYDIWLYRIYDILYNIHLIIFISYHIHTCPWYAYSGGL